MYTFENYANAGESRKWIEKFRAEHNAGLRGKACSTSTIVTADNNVWVRIINEDKLIGYARAEKEPDGCNCLHDLYVNKQHRNQGHFHSFLLPLIKFTGAKAVVLTHKRFIMHGDYYESIGFIIPIPSGDGGLITLITQECLDIKLSNGSLKKLDEPLLL